MPSISGIDSRHVIIDKRRGQYLCFPDVCRMPGGRIVCAYQEYDQHAATRRDLLVKTSEDQGRTWSAARKLPVDISHCPRLSLLGNGELHLLDTNGKRLFISPDQGDTWLGPTNPGVRTNHVVFDRPLQLGADTLLTTGHEHRGAPLPLLRQAPAEQLAYLSKDRGRTYTPLAPIYGGTDLVLCEGSLCLLPDGRIAALMRENSMVFEPMYLSLSSDRGRTWTAPEPTPLVGHRPTLGMTSSGKLLVTYRDVGPDCGTAAWLGTLDELRGSYMVHGLNRWALRPMTDPATATAEVECEVRCKAGSMNAYTQDNDSGAGMHLGLWWRILPDCVLAELPLKHENATPETVRAALPKDQLNTVRLTYASGAVTLRINGHTRAEVRVDPQQASTRIMAFGAISKTGSDGNGEKVVWKRVSQRVSEPRFGREHGWKWQATDGLPHGPKQASVLELDNDRDAHYGDFGYSGWCETGAGRFFCAYHHGGGNEPGYTPSFSSHVRGAWFSEDDFRQPGS